MKSVLITGASSGFGAQAALDLAEQGWRVFVSMRDLARGGALTAAAAAAGTGDRLSLVELDVTDPVSVDAAVAQVLAATGGGLDALLNNAGYSLLGAFEDMSEV